ncbi:bifunctional phosphoribosyl-AMP cyclohydrolase/phosphoribosyl-ATP diphosphatase HisIE [bacterium]|nr:bifunctional phosphoribosyl-AMP cyclohydrolase/phosphoribosyl-ATP diphosphatase HisIE [bacterium]
MDKKNNDLNENISSFKEIELIPAIIQDFETSEVLMLAFMNKEALDKSLATGYTWFYSRERKQLWNKGETSGNKQKIKEIYYDCDKDALLIKVIQSGAACHTGNKSCFFNEFKSTGGKSLNENEPDVILNFGNYSGIFSVQQKTEKNIEFLYELYEIINNRLLKESENSYTYRLHIKGLDEIIKKFGEESIEVILAAKHQDNGSLIYEIADLFYHLTLLMAEKKINYDDVLKELKSRKK